ncbi:hypothetical protein QMK19_03285 [Streptomyces sp. H10-C2]|uniref:hypothetical protein n=1 Tax=unclassified Streptomyces TaxID=2593676 RepID=UPI0024B99DE2|nr:MULTISPECIES: hypothetical protein [unclassified Streptomyces]MDJ0342209.1 hypothetical protein [Streptomyces sp. PH10-H1]MDJ0368723.1 hypothetical protein [Streptomyces sp. H10-C2]
MNKDIQQLLARLRKQGFTIRLARSGHYRCTSPGGQTVTVPATPRGGRRTQQNARAGLRRIGADL